MALVHNVKFFIAEWQLLRHCPLQKQVGKCLAGRLHICRNQVNSKAILWFRAETRNWRSAWRLEPHPISRMRMSRNDGNPNLRKYFSIFSWRSLG